jgi:predicted Zn-dependent protease
MPHVINGIGTWYYGKRRIHRLKNTCSFCNRVAELESYDTTLYFVVLFVPLVPLGSKRILHSCPYCRKHRYVSLKKWEADKQQAISQLLEQVEKEPDNRDTILRAIGLAYAYQDEVLFDKLATGLASHWLDDAAIQAQLGAAYGYFARRQEAEAAFRASLAVEDNPDVRKQLALTLLKQGRPEDAYPYLRPILDNKAAADVGLIWLLVESYQAQGLHERALEIMDQRDAAFPDLADDKDIKKQRKISERHKNSGKRIASAYLGESGKAGYREGNWTARVPRLIPPLVLLGALCWYLGTAFWLGHSRRVFLVNGWDQPYTITIAGQEQTLPPGAVKGVRVPEGDVSVELTDAKVPLQPVHCRIETPFFSRPFTSPTFIINPDQVAVLIWEEIEYSERPGANGAPPHFYTGKALYTLQGIDYPFEPFPPTMSVSKGGTVKKTRVSMSPQLTLEQRLSVARQALDHQALIEYGKQMLALNPNDVFVLFWLLGNMQGQEALDFLHPGLAARPVRVEWHRAYQDLMEKLHPEEDRRPRYRQLVAEMKGNPDALYLLARVEEADLDAAEQYLHQAAEANPPSIYALHALGFNALVEGRFPDAVRWAEKAHQLDPQNVVVSRGYQQALMAAKKYDELIKQLSVYQDKPGQKFFALQEQMQVYALKGDQKNAEARIHEAILYLGKRVNGPERGRLELSMRAALASCHKDVPGYLKYAIEPNKPTFYPTLLQGKLTKAAELVEEDQALDQHALLYLFALKAGDQKLAEGQWQALQKALAKDHGHSRALGEMLAGRQPVKVEQIRRFHLMPNQKRVLLVVVARRYPETAKELLPLAKTLDYDPDATSLCLQKVWE